MRPEGTDSGGYDRVDPVDDRAWEEFTPWRPGDPPTGEGRTHQRATDGTSELGRAYPSEPGLGRQEPRTLQRENGTENASPKHEGRWWTEEQPATYKVGERVRNTSPVGGVFGSAVPAGQVGRVESVRRGMFDDKFATIQFDNGYRVEVKVEKIEHKGWF